MTKEQKELLLKEEIKKFKVISEYTFYTEEPKEEEPEDLLLGASDLAEVDDDPNDVASDETPNGDDSKTAANADPNAIPEVPDAAAPNPAGPDMGADTQAPPDMNAGTDTPPLPPPDSETGGGDEVEVDVTSLVKGSEEAKQSADAASQNTNTLLAKFQDLENRVGAMAAISDKIEGLEKELIKRNPTPIESLEMRSLNSFPYNIKLTDYWKDVDGYNPDEAGKEKEYVLKQDDVDFGYADASVKKSFDENPDDMEYDEEDM